MITSSRHTLLKQLAYWNVLLHLLALLLTWFFIRPGLEPNDYEVRRTYIAHSWAWSFTWGVWMACALVQVAFYACMTAYLHRWRTTASFALILACAGLSIDLLCDVIWISVLPLICALDGDGRMEFFSLSLIASSGGLVVANGLYSIAVLLLTLCMRRENISSPKTLWLGYFVFAFGILMSLAGLIGNHDLAVLATGPTILGYCAWALLAAKVLSQREPSI